MNAISKKIRKFNTTFNKEEKIVVVLGSIVTIFAILFGLAVLIYATTKLFQWYADATAPIFRDALDKLIGIMFEGWTFF